VIIVTHSKEVASYADVTVRITNGNLQGGTKPNRLN